MMGPVGDGPRRERRPVLAAEQPAGNRLEIALVGVLEHETAARPDNPPDLREERTRILEVVQDPDAHRRVEARVGPRQGERVAEPDVEPRIASQRLTRGSDVPSTMRSISKR